jgi:hypothetical protein
MDPKLPSLFPPLAHNRVMLAKVCSAAVNGIETYPFEEEVNASFGDIRIRALGLPRLASPRGPASVHAVGFAIDHCGFFAGQIDRCRSDVFPLGELAARYFPQDELTELRIVEALAGHVRFNERGGDGVDRDATFSPLDPQSPH